jgi:hypothetical protein
MQCNAFRVLLLTIWAAFAWTTTASANWEFEGGEEADLQVARVCKEDGGTLCLELGCSVGEPLGFRLISQNMPEMVAAPRLDTLLFVGSQLAGSLEFRANGLESFRTPLEETHLRGIRQLKAGVRAQLHVWYGEDAAPEIHQFTLIGSRVAIQAAEAQCPMPDFAARELERRTMQDPAARILADMREACTVLSGSLTEGPDYAVPFDIDGTGPMDLRVNHGALVCDSTPDLVCGSAGCLTSLWVGLDDGRYRRVFMNAIQDASERQEPGVVTLSLKGTQCGSADAGPCAQRFELQGAELNAAGDPVALAVPAEAAPQP